MIANHQFRGHTAAGREPPYRAVPAETRTPSTGALRVSDAYPVIPPAGRETRLRGYPPSSACDGLRRTGIGRRVRKVIE